MLKVRRAWPSSDGVGILIRGRDPRSVTQSERDMRGDGKKGAVCTLRRVLTKSQPASTSRLVFQPPEL